MTISPAVQDLEPAALWKYFGILAEIPRPSKHEQRVQAFLEQFADEHGLLTKRDAAGNMVISRPGSGGGEHAPPVVIQGHIDMVTEKNSDSRHNFMDDPIRLVRQGDWLKADGTTLGADNGIGVAAMLALLDASADAKLPPLEALFTVEEEIGLRGAFALDASLLTGRTMLNLDTEESGQVYIGCAGGGDSELLLQVDHNSIATGSQQLHIGISGLKGGHSGLNIADGRGNAVRLLAATVAALMDSDPEMQLVSIKGGDKRNALPREASAVLAVPESAVPSVHDIVAQKQADFVAEYGLLEETVCLQSNVADAAEGQALAPDSADKLLTLLLTLPHGVVKMSHAVEGLVETSNNLASVAPLEDGKTYQIVQTTRSSIGAALTAQRQRIARLGRLAGAEVNQNDAYPGWAPNPQSKIVQLTAEVFEELNNSPPELKAIHAGLECGIIGERCPGMDMVSFGPTITGAHSPDEQVEISTVPPFFEATQKILQRLADAK